MMARSYSFTICRGKEKHIDGCFMDHKGTTAVTTEKGIFMRANMKDYSLKDVAGIYLSKKWLEQLKWFQDQQNCDGQ